MSFRRLKAADNFKARLAAYEAWRDKSPGEKQNAYEALNVDRFTYERQVIYVAPFNIIGRDLFVECKAPATGQNQPTPQLLGLAATYFETAAPTTAGVTVITNNNLFPIGNLAKLTLKLRVRTATNKDSSRITTAKYYRHGTNSASMPFGKAAAGDTFESVLRAIKAKPAYDQFVTVKGNAISVLPEKA